MRIFNFKDVGKAAVLLLLTSLCVKLPANAQTTGRAQVQGTVSEIRDGRQLPLDFATVTFPDYAIGTTTRSDGSYIISNLPEGKARMKVSYLGKLTVDTIVDVRSNVRLDFTLRDEDFKIKEITVVAKNNVTGQATSSTIGRTAIDHLQATNLFDLMQLVPGGLFTEPNLSNARQLNIRSLGTGSSADNLNSLGTAVIQDGAPVSNNSNLSAMNPTVKGASTALGGGASPAGGVDARTFSTDNIESVEVIRGIPSVEYGDLTSGAVIINAKAGREPLRVNLKANPKVYQGSLSTGFLLGGNNGALNVSGDYAYNVNDPKQSYLNYQRVSARVLYSNVFFKNRLRSNTSFSFNYGRDARDRNPDDELYQTASHGKTAGFTLNTNGTLSLDLGWLRSLRYVLSGTYTDRDSHYETVYSSANAPYSMTTTDGTVLSNTAGKHVFDASGQEITHFSAADAALRAIYLPASYKGGYDIDSREINVFAKLTASLFKQFGQVDNRILIGADFQTDGNVGRGKTFDPSAPPYRDLQAPNATFRPRSYKDIPFINQAGLFAEENLKWHIGRRELNLQAGVRMDHASVVGTVFSPRVNASFDVIPQILTLRGGYGITAKMPTLLYLHPENAYFEYVNMNELTNEQIPEADRMFITTTKVYNSENPDLKAARNHKSEIGLDLRIGKASLSVTAFSERLRDGYALDATLNTFKSFKWNEYGRDAAGNIVQTGSYPVLSYYYTPTNNLAVNTKGVEFDLNMGRIDAIRTAFSLSGAWMRTESYDTGYNFYDNSSTAASSRKNVAVYAGEARKDYSRMFSTTLRATHNIPSIGFVVTLSAQAVWQDMNWSTFGNDSIPVGYLALEDASFKAFKPGQYTTTQQLKDEGLSYLLQDVSHSAAIREAYKPYFCFNINVTKQVSENFRVSFFANNMFRSYPRRESKRSPGTYYNMNNRFYFGMEAALTL